VGTPGRRSSDLPIVTFPHDLHRRHAPVHTGSLATYIPELADADPSSGIALVTVEEGWQA
jgi:glutaminase